MARLRRKSSASDGPLEDYEFSQRRPPEPTFPGASVKNAPTGKSPRKQLQAPYQGFTQLRDDDFDHSDTKLLPKLLPQGTSRSKQVRLGTLAVTGCANQLWPKGPPAKPSPWPLASGTTASKRTESICRKQKPTVSAKQQIVIESDSEDVDADIEIEESVWCGSDTSYSGYESEDELPSPRKLLGLPRKSQPPEAKVLKVSSNTVSDPLLGFDALEIDYVKVGPTPPRRPPQLPNLPCSRRISSSDKENNDRAILRFSPPRLHCPKRQGDLDRLVNPPPVSYSTSRLMSPSKTKMRIPTPPLRQSLDAFWNADTVNGWNDQYSPKKVLKSPKKTRFRQDELSQSPSSPARKCQSPTKRTKAEVQAKKDWESRKHKVAQDFLEELDRTVTEGRIVKLAASTGGVHFVWSRTLNSTAGRAHWRRESIKTRNLDGNVETVQKHHASIELAEKVIDDEHRLLNVVAHEFCHLANFMISGIKDQPHGQQFKAWGRKCTEAFGDRGVEVTTKHSYQIEYKYMWQCVNEDCLSEYKRHSKSIDPKRQTCGRCRSRLVQIKPIPRKEAATGTKSYAAYVKQHYAAIKQGMPGASQKEVMEAVGRQHRAEKEAADKASKSRKQVLLNEEEDVNEIARVLDFVTLSIDD